MNIRLKLPTLEQLPGQLRLKQVSEIVTKRQNKTDFLVRILFLVGHHGDVRSGRWRVLSAASGQEAQRQVLQIFRMLVSRDQEVDHPQVRDHLHRRHPRPLHHLRPQVHSQDVKDKRVSRNFNLTFMLNVSVSDTKFFKFFFTLCALTTNKRMLPLCDTPPPIRLLREQGIYTEAHLYTSALHI